MDFFFSLIVFMPMYVSLFWMLTLLLTRGADNKAKQFLGIFMLVTSLLYLSHSVYFSHQYQLYVFFDPLYVLAMLSVYPLYYGYIKKLTTDYRFNPALFLSLAPAVLISVSVAILYGFMDNGVDFVRKFHYAEGLLPKDHLPYQLQKYLIVFSKLIFFVQIVWFLYRGLKLIRSYEKRLLEFYSDTEKRNVSWVKWLILFFTLTGLASTVANIVGRAYFHKHEALLLIPVLVFSLLIFILGYLGYMQSHSVYELDAEQNENDQRFKDPKVQLYENSEQVNPILKHQLLRLFDDEKIYRKTDLKISHVSEMLNTNRTYVSRLINSEFGYSFSYFVNRYRIDETMELLAKIPEKEAGLEEIAEKVGFPSVGSLIRNFKQITGVTPGAFRKMKK